MKKVIVGILTVLVVTINVNAQFLKDINYSELSKISSENST